MAINIIQKKKSFPSREQFEARLKAMSFKHKSGVNYTAWRFFADYLVIRTYDTYYSIHTNGDIEHYEVHSASYDNVRYEMNNFEFIEHIMNKK